MNSKLVSRALLASVFLGLGSFATAALAPEPEIFDVRAFGAVGDGIAMDTKALQDAIDACSASSGGGTVRVPISVTLGIFGLGMWLWKPDIRTNARK